MPHDNTQIGFKYKTKKNMDGSEPECYEKSDLNCPGTMQPWCNRFDAEVAAALMAMMILIPVVGILLLGLLVGWIVFAVMVPWIQLPKLLPKSPRNSPNRNPNTTVETPAVRATVPASERKPPLVAFHFKRPAKARRARP